MEVKILPVSVLIPTMDRPDSLCRTLEKIMAGAALPAQIVIVDQSVREDIRAANRTVMDVCGGKVCCCYLFQAEPSLTKARNTAFAKANEDLCIFLDDDVDVYGDSILNVCELMRDGKIALVAGIDDNASPPFTKLGYLLGTRSFKNRKIGCVTKSMLGRYPDEIKGVVDTQWAMGFFFAVRKSIVEKYGVTWDEKLKGYAYPEDLDFSYSLYKKCKRDGYSCILSETVRVKHLISREYRIPSRQHQFKYILNRRYLANKHNMGFISLLAMDYCDLWKIVFAIVRKENAKDLIDALLYYFMHRKEVFRGELPD